MDTGRTGDSEDSVILKSQRMKSVSYAPGTVVTIHEADVKGIEYDFDHHIGERGTVKSINKHWRTGDFWAVVTLESGNEIKAPVAALRRVTGQEAGPFSYRMKNLPQSIYGPQAGLPQQKGLDAILQTAGQEPVVSPHLDNPGTPLY